MNPILLNKYKQKIPLHILIFPGGTENGLEIMRSLAPCKEFIVFSASNNSINHAPFSYNNHFTVADINRSEQWVDDINEIIIREKIDLLFPANSLMIDEILKFRKKLLCEVILPDQKIVTITRSKSETINILKDCIPTPKVYPFNAIKENDFPVFAKPDKGYGSQGAIIINDSFALKNYDANYQDYIFQELLTGAEYTVDCFSTSEGRLLYSSGRERIRVRMGTSMHAEDLPLDLEDEIQGIAFKISHKLKIPGLWFFQLKKDSLGKLKLLEVDIRVAGTMCFNRCRGINFPKLSVLQSIGLSVEILKNTDKLVLDRSLANRYYIDINYRHVYVDLDDCLVIHQKLNIQLVTFLFQAFSSGKKIHLISKCLLEQKDDYLKSFRIHQLFDEIIWLKDEDNKSDYITEKESIFIDDSFSQRKEVAEKIGIPTYDPTMIEALLDQRY